MVDPRTLTPSGRSNADPIRAKTGGAVIIDEGYNHFGTTAELAATIAYGAFDYLDAPIERLGAMDVPIPFTPLLEFATIPDEEQPSLRRYTGSWMGGGVDGRSRS